MGKLCKIVCVSLSPPSHTGTRRLARPCVVNLGRVGLTLWESGSLDWTHTPRRARSMMDPSPVDPPPPGRAGSICTFHKLFTQMQEAARKLS
jgi:hypothetical protein